MSPNTVSSVLEVLIVCMVHREAERHETKTTNFYYSTKSNKSMTIVVCIILSFYFSRVLYYKAKLRARNKHQA